MPKKPAYPKKVTRSQAHIARAVRELNVKQTHGSAYHVRLVGNRLELHMLVLQRHFGDVTLCIAHA